MRTMKRNLIKGLQKGLSIYKESPIWGVLSALMCLCLFFTVFTEKFLTLENLLTVMRQISELGTITMGMTILIISKEFDLSVGSAFALISIIIATLVKGFGIPIWLAAPLGLAAGALMGLVNGLVTVKLHIPSFLTTISSMMVFRGLALIVSGGWPIGGLPSSAFYNVFGGRIAGVFPAPAIWFIVVAIISWFILHQTAFGYRCYATGSNTEAARLAGIKVDRIKITNFILTAVLTGFAGILYLSYLGSAAPTQGMGLEMEAIASTVVGGTALFGGSGTILGAFLGTIIIGVVRNGLILMGATAYTQQTFLGLVIITAIIINVWTQRAGR